MKILRLFCVAIAVLVGLGIKILFLHYGNVGDSTSNFFGVVAFAGTLAFLVYDPIK